MKKKVLVLVGAVAAVTALVVFIGRGSTPRTEKPSRACLASGAPLLPLEELVPGLDWSDWYRHASGYQPNPEHFGAYVATSAGTDLYIGFGTGLPTLGDGALIARWDGRELQTVGSLAEEGVHEMLWDSRSGTLHIAGTDPSWPDDWTAGNHYTYSPSGGGTIVKRRDPRAGLVNVIHTWGLWITEDHALYAAVSAHDGSFRRDKNFIRRAFDRIVYVFDRSYYSSYYGVTRMGQIFRSVDGGVSWRHVSELGDFRAYDVLEAHHKMYAIYTDTPESACRLAVSEDGGETWRDFSQNRLERAHLILFRDKVLAVGERGEAIYAVDGSTMSKHSLPSGFRVNSQFNVLAPGRDCLYALCTEEGGNHAILRTCDLSSWAPAACTTSPLVSISYWQTADDLIVGGAGKDGKLWRIDLSESGTLVSAKGYR